MEFKENPKKIGFVQKTHGVHGGLVIETSKDILVDLGLPKWIFMELEGSLVPYELNSDESFIRDNRHMVIFIKGVDTPDLGARFLESTICFPEEFINPNTESGSSLTISQGYQVFFEGHSDVGILKELIEIPGNPVMSIDIGGKEILVPANNEFIIKQDDGLKTIHLNIPDELLDLN